MKRTFIILVVLIIVSNSISYYMGYKNSKKEIIERALSTDKKIYNNSDLEKIIFNEYQL